LTSINVKNNGIPLKKEEEIYQMVRMNKLNIALSDKSLTELDVSGIGFGAEGAKEVAQYVSDNGALLRLDMSSNKVNSNMNGEAAAAPGTALSDALAVNTVLTELDLSNNYLKPEFARELAVGIRDNGAMTSLNLASNRLYAGGAKIVAEAIKVTKCTLAIILVPILCRSDFSINCCCLLLSAGYGDNIVVECPLIQHQH
jgi:Ran GTPase-activating protein (RanGAP) involved in mRNA processing and transport